VSSQNLPSAKDQLDFIKWIQRLFSDGDFTATYKYALIIALTDLAVELGEDSSAPLTLSMTSIAEKVAELYWNQTTPFPNPFNEEHILSQNIGRQAFVVNQLVNLRSQGIGNLAKARDSEYWGKTIKAIANNVYKMPVLHLQNIAGGVEEVLYKIPSDSSQLILKTNVGYCLREYQTLIQRLARGGWLEHVRNNKNNLGILGPGADLESFMFQASRNSLIPARQFLNEFQKERCFYCGKKIHDTGDVDHFIPWSRYPRDLGHNFVLAHGACNRSKRDWLASQKHLENWIERNIIHDSIIQSSMRDIGFIVDLDSSKSIAKWAYAQAIDNNLLTWVAGRTFEPINAIVLNAFD
jgi:hypothetical protein